MSRFVGIDNNQVACFSDDGEVWYSTGVPIMAPLEGNLKGGVSGNNNVLVYFEDYANTQNMVVFASRDGATWRKSVTSLPVTTGFINLFYTGGFYAALLTGGGTRHFGASSDGRNWETSALPSLPVGAYYSTVVWNGEFFCAVAYGYDTVFHSPDGRTWTPHPNTGLTNCRNVIWTGNRFLAISVLAGFVGVISESFDGINWRHVSFNFPPGADLHAIACTGGPILATAYPTQASGTNHLFSASGSIDDFVAFSNDGILTDVLTLTANGQYIYGLRNSVSGVASNDYGASFNVIASAFGTVFTIPPSTPFNSPPFSGGVNTLGGAKGFCGVEISTPFADSSFSDLVNPDGIIPTKNGFNLRLDQ